MLIRDILYEAPLADFDMIGDPDTEGSFRTDDLKKFRNPQWREKIVRAFQRTPYKFNIYMMNGAEGRVAVGDQNPVEVRNLSNLERYVGIQPMALVTSLIGKVPPDTADSITILMVENEGTNRISLTPWMLAHRVGHALIYAGQAERSDGGLSADLARFQTVRGFFSTMNTMLNAAGDMLEGSLKYDDLKWEKKAERAFRVAKMIGKMRSARTGNLASIGEFFIETIAQYLTTGAVSFNHPDIDDAISSQFEQLLDRFQQAVTQKIEAVLQMCVGKAVVL